METVRIEMGVLLRSQFRKLLKHAGESGHVTAYTEYKRFLDSTFLVTGTRIGLLAIAKMIEKVNE